MLHIQATNSVNGLVFSATLDVATYQDTTSKSIGVSENGLEVSIRKPIEVLGECMSELDTWPAVLVEADCRASLKWLGSLIYLLRNYNSWERVVFWEVVKCVILDII